MTNYLTLISKPDSFCQQLVIKSIGDNFLNENLSLCRLSNELDNGKFIVKALLVYLITDVALFFEVGKNMGGEQVRQTADLILEDYSHFKPEDFKLCFNRAKKGHYGKLYDRLDGQIVMGWLMDYDKERDSEIEAIHAKENRQLKQLAATLINTPEQPDELFKTNMEILRKQLVNNKLMREKTKDQPKVNYDPVYLISQEWIKQFHKLHCLRQLGNNKGTKFIKRYGKILDINGYLEHKHWQYSNFNKLIK